MKKLLVLSSLLLPFALNAAEVYNNDGTTLDIGGEFNIKAGNNSSDADNKRFVSENNSSRFHANGSKEINDDLKALLEVEWGFDPLAGDPGDQLFSNRLGNVGLESKKWGTFKFGRQWSVYYDIAGWTDMYEGTGGEALGVYDDTDSGGFNGLGRANDAATWRKTFGGLTIGLQAQAADLDGASGTGVGADQNITRSSSEGISAVYALSDAFDIGVAYNRAELTDTTGTFNDQDVDQAATVLGVNFHKSKLNIAVNVSSESNIIRYGENSMGVESYLAYDYDDSGSHIYVGTNTVFGQYNDGDDTNTDINYLAIGFLHSLVPDTSFYVYGEYRYDLRSDEDIDKVNSSLTPDSRFDSDYVGVNMSQYRLGVKYVF